MPSSGHLPKVPKPTWRERLWPLATPLVVVAAVVVPLIFLDKAVEYGIGPPVEDRLSPLIGMILYGGIVGLIVWFITTVYWRNRRE